MDNVLVYDDDEYGLWDVDKSGTEKLIYMFLVNYNATCICKKDDAKVN